METCLRCGSCCKGQFCYVPRYPDSDLSPGHLEEISKSRGHEAMRKYIVEHSLEQGARCIWLRDNEDGTTTCTAYDRRSKTCRDFNTDGSCHIWMQAFGLI